MPSYLIAKSQAGRLGPTEATLCRASSTGLADRRTSRRVSLRIVDDLTLEADGERFAFIAHIARNGISEYLVKALAGSRS